MRKDIKIIISSRFAKLSSIWIVAIIGYILADVLIQFFSPVVASTIPKSLIHKQAETYEAKFNKVFLFGKPNKATPAITPPSPVESVPIYNFQLSIIGIIKSDFKERSVAILKVRNNPTKSFSIYEMLDAETELIEIGDNFVTVIHKAMQARFYIYPDKGTVVKDINLALNSGKIGMSNNPSAKTLNRIPKTFSKTKLPINSNLPTGNNISVNLPTSFEPKLKTIRKKLQVNPISLMNLFAGAPVIKNGKIYGIKISPGSDVALFKALQFKNKDVIMSINNIPLNNPANLGKLINLATSSTVFNIALERNGYRQLLTVALP